MKKTDNLGIKIKTAVKQSGLSRKDLAQEMEISEANLYKLFRADDAKLSTIIKLSEVSGLPLTYFFDIDESGKTKELVEELEKERKNNELLRSQLLNQNYFTIQALFIIDIMMEISSGSKDVFTLILPTRTKKIPSSRVYKLLIKLPKMLEANSQGDELSKAIITLVNIREFRKLLIDPPDELTDESWELMKYFQSKAIQLQQEDGYVEFKL